MVSSKTFSLLPLRNKSFDGLPLNLVGKRHGILFCSEIILGTALFIHYLLWADIGHRPQIRLWYFGPSLSSGFSLFSTQNLPSRFVPVMPGKVTVLLSEGRGDYSRYLRSNCFNPHFGDRKVTWGPGCWEESWEHTTAEADGAEGGYLAAQGKQNEAVQWPTSQTNGKDHGLTLTHSRSLCVLSHLILTTMLWGRHNYVHFTGKDLEQGT